MQIHRGIKDVPCDICGQMFYSKTFLWSHKMQSKCGAEEVVCPTCGKKCKNKVRATTWFVPIILKNVKFNTNFHKKFHKIFSTTWSVTWCNTLERGLTSVSLRVAEKGSSTHKLCKTIGRSTSTSRSSSAASVPRRSARAMHWLYTWSATMGWELTFHILSYPCPKSKSHCFVLDQGA